MTALQGPAFKAPALGAPMLCAAAGFGGDAESITVLDETGASYMISLTVLDETGAGYEIPATVLDENDNPYLLS